MSAGHSLDLRKIIQAEANRRGWTSYKLWQACAPHISKQTVYNYLAGKSEISAASAGVMLSALGLQIVSAPQEKI